MDRTAVRSELRVLALSDVEASRISVRSSMGKVSGSMVMLSVILAVLLEGCWLFPRKVTMDDPQVQRLVKAAESFDRTTYDGPKEYKTVDGVFNEAITLTYETQTISGYPINQLNVSYRGEDPRLEAPKQLTLAGVKPILKEWGY